MDRIEPEHRSWNMSRIRSKDTTPEHIVRTFLHRRGFRFRLHVKDLPGHPDIVLPKYRTVIDVRGCFWHRHNGCKYAYTPKTRIDFWQKKFDDNVKRDIANERLLSNLGYIVLVIWECEISDQFMDTICAKIKGTAKQERQIRMCNDSGA